MDLKFKQDGLTFYAGKGYCYVLDKNGERVFSAIDVFPKKPTKEMVLKFYRIFSEISDNVANSVQDVPF